MAAEAGEEATISEAVSTPLQRRRQKLATITTDETFPAPESLAVAFSGGGIRSATISLGAAQAFAKAKRLLDFDYVTSVSGGGYFASFLVSLFTPTAVRGFGEPISADKADDDDVIKQHADYAHRALTSDAREEIIVGPNSKPIRNPVWWLREHSRYLAPNGATDYAMSATYLIRNWLGMLYVFSLPIAVFFMLAFGLLQSLVGAYGPAGDFILNAIRGVNPFADCAAHVGTFRPTFLPYKPEDVPLISPLLLFAPVVLFLGLASGLSYWLTEWLSSKRKWTLFFVIPIAPKHGPALFLGGLAGTGLVTAWASSVLWGVGCEQVNFAVYLGRFGTALILASVLIGFILWLRTIASKTKAFVSELRRHMTKLTSVLNIALLVVLGLGMIDTAAIWLQNRDFGVGSSWLTGIGVITTLGAWLMNKIPGWFGGTGKITEWIASHVSTTALIAGTGLFATLALFTDLIVQRALWNGAPWMSRMVDDLWWWNYAYCALALLILFVLTGASTGFINLSSLHNLYAARLTRAYLGGSNALRLQEALDKPGYAKVTESHARDDIRIRDYQEAITAAPLHLINVTLNETRNKSGSQLVERDRKGVPVTFGPEGVFINAGREGRPGQQCSFTWDEIKTANAESLSVGQLCAISGAAASSGMGAHTTLGTSLAMTFGNIRLGYWWRTGRLLGEDASFFDDFWGWLYLKVTRPLRTYFYLWNEMTSSYSRAYERLNLSDGGHFDNSGTYELLRRGVKTIVVYDNGADPDYRFDDLENIIRKARIDLGISLNVASPTAVTRMVGKKGAALFLNGSAGDWRARAKTTDGDAVALMLFGYAHVFDEEAQTQTLKHRHTIIWMKPRIYDGVTQDVVGYRNNHPHFPQETTGDQFFDEAQWESYRAMGEAMTSSLIERSIHGKDILRHVASRVG